MMRTTVKRPSTCNSGSSMSYHQGEELTPTEGEPTEEQSGEELRKEHPTSTTSSSTAARKANKTGPRPKEQQHDAEESVAQRETKAVNVLRAIVLCLLLATTALVSVGVYLYASRDEKEAFEADFHANAHRIVDSFHDSIERRLSSINSMATSITSYALDTKQNFPFVTVPHFEHRGSDLRVQADATIIHWTPLVTNENREAWEVYALENRAQIDKSFVEDAKQRRIQDEEFGLTKTTETENKDNRMLQEQTQHSQQELPMTVLDDGTGYHSRIWSNGSTGAPKGDEPDESGPYLPLWQRSPINGAKQKTLNMNFANLKVFHGILPKLLETKQAVLNRATVPVPAMTDRFKANLALGQYRHDIAEYLDDPLTFFAYPVFDSFDEDRKVAGVLATNVYWKMFFSNILPPSALGIICVLENSYGQTLAFRIDGADVTYLGEEDPHDPRYDSLEEFADVNAFVESRAGPQTRSYSRVPLSTDFGRYTLRVYPSQDTEEAFATNRPLVYAVVVASAFLFSTVAYVLFAYVVERRQQIVMDRVRKESERVAATEREVNEFLLHELGGPISAALSAHSFVTSAINETSHIADETFRESLQNDGKVVTSSLHFIEMFLKSMLDLYHFSAADEIQVECAPVDIVKDVLEPVRCMLHEREGGVDIAIDCPEQLAIATDCLRLQLIILTLSRNSAKFVRSPGFIRLRAKVVNGFVELHVEDSGPGIPKEKRRTLFEKCQTRLDDGTGVGLFLTSHLTKRLGGDIWLDESYNSGVQGAPGAKFVIQLNALPLPEETVVSKPCKPAAPQGGTGDDSSASHGTTKTGSMELPVLPENLSVLFCDDDTILRRLFSRSVKRFAPTWKIQEASNGETAIQLVESDRFDLIFMDQYMGSAENQLLGTETVRHLRSMGYSSTICGLSANNLEEEFIAAGADDFLLKPFPCDKVAFERELGRLLGATRSVSPLLPPSEQ